MLAIESVHGLLGFMFRGQVHEAIVVVTRLEALCRVRGKQLADLLTDN